MRILALALVAGGCTGKGGDGTCTLTGVIDADTLSAALIDGAPTFAEVTVAVSETADLSVRATAAGAPDVEGAAAEGVDGEATLALRGLRPDTTYTVEARADVDGACEAVTTTLTTGTLAGTPPLLDLRVDDGSHSGWLLALYTAIGDGAEGIALYDRGGVAVWSWESAEELSAMQFVEPVAGGEGVLALHAELNDEEKAHVEVVGWDGARIDDHVVPFVHHSLTQKVPGVAFAALKQVQREVPGFGESCGTDSDVVLGDAIVEVAEDGTETEVWNAFDALEVECHDQLEFGGQGNDWTHLNAIDYDPATDRWLVSQYWTGVVRAIDRGTGETAFTLGGGSQTDCDEVVIHQHGAEFTPDGVALFDNGHTPARMAAFRVDGEGVCEAAETFPHPDELTAQVLGDIDIVDDRWYTAWGDDGDLMVIDPGDADIGDATAVWHASVSTEYEDDHGGTILGSIAFLPTLTDEASAR
jgi:hypothetical protein